MEEKYRNKLLNSYSCFDGENRKYANIAIERLEKINPFAFSRENTEHKKTLEEADLFGDINKIVKLLENLKKEGYTEIRQEWSGYVDNYFVAVKVEKETDEEMYVRFRDIVKKEALRVEHEHEQKAKKAREIAELKLKIKKLENELL